MFNLAVGNTVYIILHLGPYILKKSYTSIPLALIIPLCLMLISIGAEGNHTIDYETLLLEEDRAWSIQDT
ncbi:MAG: hypothetical protein ACUVTM_07085 [Candidatus Bathyarchaeia archaeon]